MSRIRGGAWNNRSIYLPAPRNIHANDDFQRATLGFRIVRDSKPYILRGGAYTNSTGVLYSAVRDGNDIDFRFCNMGLRVIYND